MIAPLLALASFAPAAQDAPEAGARPNVLVVMTDDQGLGDFGGASNPVLRTPRLDAFAAECPDVARFYVSPVCAPTRAALMTGRYGYRTGVVDTYRGRAMMHADEVTIAEALGQAGYRTGIFGKWHLGDAYPLRAMDQGFDVALVHRGGGLAQPSEPVENERRYTDPILERNGALVRTEGYCTDVYVDEALAFCRASVEADEPFFAYVAPNAPHGPFHDVPEELYRAYLERDLESVRTGERAKLDVIARIYAMVENIDGNFGRLLDGLDALGVADDTIVVFLTDNGPTPGRYVRGLRGAKTDVHEGGIRSPLWVRWPGRLSPETRVEVPLAHIDLMPTLLDAAGVAAPEGVAFDGRSALGLLDGTGDGWTDRSIFVQSHRGDAPARDHHCAVIGPRWKLVRASGFGRRSAPGDARWRLYDLLEDPAETTDRLLSSARVADDLHAAYRSWFDDVSTSRATGFAPPRIEPCTPREPVTTLTRQDWRCDGKEGWGAGGRWLLRVDEPIEVDVTLVFVRERTLEAARLDVAGSVVELRADGTERREHALGRFTLPAGDVDLGVVCLSESEESDPYQVVLERANR
ncbi:MAG: arylsulfatase [Planctomycetota bacterium]